MKFLKFWFPVIAYSVMIFCVSSIEKLQVSVGLFFLDKVIHSVEYALLGYLVARALFQGGVKFQLSKSHVVFCAFLFCALYGFSDEVHQIFVAGRVSSSGDLIADSIGGLIGGIFYVR